MAWLAVAAPAIEVTGREVARGSAIFALTGLRPGLWLLVAVAAAGALLGMATRARRTAFVLAALFTAGVACQIQLGARLQSDGFYYFAYLRSLAFDRDVNFTNDYRLLGLGDKANLFQPTPTGYAQSAWTIGPAIVWSPFFAAGHIVALRRSATNPDVTANGISYPYRQAVCVAGLVYGLFGCWFCVQLTSRFYGARLAVMATTMVVGGSFMLWYLVKEPSMTHAPSMAAAAGFVWAWIATRDGRTRTQFAALGALAGFITLIRWQNALFALLPACDAIVSIVAAARAGDRANLVRTIKDGALFTACATLAFTPQMAAWHAIYGSWLAVSPVGPQIRWTDPHLADILWSSRNGLLSWSPVLYPASIGVVILAVSRPAIGLPVLLTFAAMTYFNASIQDWWGSAGYGGRRFDGVIPLFCLGFAALCWHAANVIRRHPLRVVSAMGGLLILWNLTLMSAAQDGIVRIGEPVSFGDTFGAQARAFHRWFGNPFTYPASLGFALRNGMPPATYDLLSANRFLSDPLRPFGRVDLGASDQWLVEDGWHGAEREGTTTFRWASSPAVVLIPLDHPAPLIVQIRLHAFAYPGSPPQTVAVDLNGSRTSTVVPVPNGWETIEIPVGRASWRTGVNRLQLEFGYASRPSDVGLGGDTRLLAAAVDYINVEQK